MHARSPREPRSRRHPLPDPPPRQPTPHVLCPAGRLGAWLGEARWWPVYVGSGRRLSAGRLMHPVHAGSGSCGQGSRGRGSCGRGSCGQGSRGRAHAGGLTRAWLMRAGPRGQSSRGRGSRGQGSCGRGSCRQGSRGRGSRVSLVHAGMAQADLRSHRCGSRRRARAGATQFRLWRRLGRVYHRSLP